MSMIKDYKAGMPIKEMEIKYGVSPPIIYRELKKNKVSVGHRKKERQKLSDKTIRYAIDKYMINKNLTYKDICKEFDISASTFQKYLIRYEQNTNLKKKRFMLWG